MPLNQSEKVQVCRAFLKCFGEDAELCGRTLRFIDQFTAGQTNLLDTLKAEALVWQPFIDAGLSIDWWNQQMEHRYNTTDVS
jgi:hypothetical protein